MPRSLVDEGAPPLRLFILQALLNLEAPSESPASSGNHTSVGVKQSAHEPMPRAP